MNGITQDPSYIHHLDTGELYNRVAQAQERLTKCSICAWECGIDRLSGTTGICKTGAQAKVSSYGAHLGEENPLRGWRGSGTIFFTRCNLRCQYCQNHEISQTDSGYQVNAVQLAEIMLELQAAGCHNINFVSPSHVVPQILAGVLVAAQSGLRIPLVYNTGGYDSLETLRLLDGVFDIYMPDMKYADARIARKYSKIPRYPEINQQAVLEMYRQVGDLQINVDGLAEQGLLIRHLVLPNNLAGTEQIIHFIANKVSKNTYTNIMGQYHPDYKADQYEVLSRRITRAEFLQALNTAQRAGLTRLD